MPITSLESEPFYLEEQVINLEELAHLTEHTLSLLEPWCKDNNER